MARAETLTPSLDSCAQTTWQRSVSRRGSFDGRIASAERWKAAVAAQSARCSEQRVSFPRHFKVLTGGSRPLENDPAALGTIQTGRGMAHMRSIVGWRGELVLREKDKTKGP
jgi:hypothetical protein